MSRLSNRKPRPAITFIELKGYEPTARRSADLFVLDFSNPDYLPADSRQLFLDTAIRDARYRHHDQP